MGKDKSKGKKSTKHGRKATTAGSKHNPDARMPPDLVESSEDDSDDSEKARKKKKKTLNQRKEHTQTRLGLTKQWARLSTRNYKTKMLMRPKS